MNDYYTILPAKIRYDQNLPANAKILYSELVALCSDQGFCWASNGYFAKLYGVDKATVSRWVSKLHKFGYIFFKNEDKNAVGDDEKINEYRQICITPIDKKVNPNIKEKNIKKNISHARARSEKTNSNGAYDLEAFERYLDSK